MRKTDWFDRLLRYVYLADEMMVNREMARLCPGVYFSAGCGVCDADNGGASFAGEGGASSEIVSYPLPVGGAVWLCLVSCGGPSDFIRDFSDTNPV